LKREETIDFNIKAAWHAIARMYNQQAIKYGGTMSVGFALLNINSEEGTPATKIGPLMGLETRSLTRLLKSMDEKGLIYRGPRLINWSPGLKTAVSDLEVEYEEEDATLYYFKYKLKDSDEFIPVATIRPETILGDTGVAVHPDDERYQKYVGKTVIVPTLGREIPVIADHYVTMDFGTGALKVTPMRKVVP